MLAARRHHSNDAGSLTRERQCHLADGWEVPDLGGLEVPLLSRGNLPFCRDQVTQTGNRLGISILSVSGYAIEVTVGSH